VATDPIAAVPLPDVNARHEVVTGRCPCGEVGAVHPTLRIRRGCVHGLFNFVVWVRSPDFDVGRCRL
jgi:hypothetical protein